MASIPRLDSAVECPFAGYLRSASRQWRRNGQRSSRCPCRVRPADAVVPTERAASVQPGGISARCLVSLAVPGQSGD